jgi:hypothetical protein
VSLDYELHQRFSVYLPLRWGRKVKGGLGISLPPGRFGSGKLFSHEHRLCHQEQNDMYLKMDPPHLSTTCRKHKVIFSVFTIRT